jgi:hypothetical protein
VISGRGEAVDIFRKWLAERTVIRWQGSFGDFAFGAWGVVEAVDTRELRLLSDDRRSALVVIFRDAMTFSYLDSSQVTGEQKKFEECIVIAMGTELSDGDEETISLAALKS